MNSPSRTRSSITFRSFLLSGLMLASIAGATNAAQQEATPATDTAKKTAAASTPATTGPTDLVAAAKASRAGRESSGTRKKITNKDVKKSTGRLIFISEAPMPKEPEKTEAQIARENDTRPLAEREAAHVRDRRDVSARVAAAEKKVAELTDDLARLEHRYYESNNPAERDTTLKSQFDTTRRQLDEARVELAAARDAQTALETPAGQ